MRADLFPFQAKALGSLRLALAQARANNNNFGANQVVSFTAPTGAGKTIIMASLIESVYAGDDLYINQLGRTHSFPEEPEAIFLWISDSPELNEQSKLKIELKTDRLRFGQCVTVDESICSREVLEDGKIYFLNTQKLSVSSNLTKTSDTRQYTIWEILSNTVREKGNKLVVIIDEAHRGAIGREAGKATTIMQRFIKGWDGGLPAMPIVIGMSATIERFNGLIGSTLATMIPVAVTPEEVRASGLLKDIIKIRYPEDQSGDKKMAVLQAGAIEWRDKWDHWDQYCREQHYAYIKPVFIVQVENGTADRITATDLDDCIIKIEEKSGFTFEEGEVVHTFGQTTGAIEAAGLKIPYVEPSKISDDKKIKVVFFKENLSTGWDCPRAEAMVSFRRAQDATYIAQLLGRMVRTPMQCRIQVDASLNEVHLFLPFFDKDTVEKVVEQLNSSENGFIPADIQSEEIGAGGSTIVTVKPDASGREIPLTVPRTKVITSPDDEPLLFPDPDVEPSSSSTSQPSSPATTTVTWVEPSTSVPFVRSRPTPSEPSLFVATGGTSDDSPVQKPQSIPSVRPVTVHYNRASIVKAINDMGLTTYDVRTVKINTYLVSILELCGLLSRSGIYADALVNLKSDICEMIRKHVNALKLNHEYPALYEQIRSYRMQTIAIDAFGQRVAESEGANLFSSSDEDVERQFRAANATLGKCGVGNLYGQKYYSDIDPLAYMIDVIIFANDERCIEDLNCFAKKKFIELNNQYRRIVAAKGIEKITREYNTIVSNSDKITPHVFQLPGDYFMDDDPDGIEFQNHLFVHNDTGTVKIKLNGWEQRLLEEEEMHTDFLCWFRNPSRWAKNNCALCIPYVMNDVQKGAFPDFLIIRKDPNTGLVVDILEPHDSSRIDNLPKAKGFVRYAKENPIVGRVQLIREMADSTGKKRLKRLDLTDMRVQERVLLANNNEDLGRIFTEDGFFGA